MGPTSLSTGRLLCLSLFLLISPIPPFTQANFHSTLLYEFEIPHSAFVSSANQLAKTRLISINLAKLWKDGNAGAAEVTEYRKRLDEMMGRVPKPGTHGKKGIFNVITKAYNSRIVVDRAYHQALKYGQNITDEEVNALHFKRKVDAFYKIDSSCDLGAEFGYFNLKKLYWYAGDFGNVTELIEDIDKDITAYCLNRFVKEGVTNLVNYTLRAYTAALFITTLQLDIMTDFDRYTVNGRKTRWEAPVGPLRRMLKDTDESLNAIEEGLVELHTRHDEATRGDVAEYWKGVIDSIEGKLTRHPLDKLYGGGGTKSTEIIDSARKTWESLKGEIVKLREFRPYFQRYKYDVAALKEDIQSPILEEFWSISKAAYEKYLKVERVKGGGKGELDPNWDFDLTKPLQKLRVGWDHLDSVAEEIKCHLRKSYWLDTRNETLRATQMNLDKGRIFGHFSRTLYQPCRNNDTDLVDRCNYANHEICRPSEPSEEQEKYIQLTGDLSIYRPKWVYRRTEEEPKGVGAKCEGVRTYVIPLKLCRCGFILDCGKDIGIDLKCVLQENDDMRKQCKGSVGYPCKSIPLAPGRHDVSCVTGNCDMVMNSCEWDRD